MKGFSKILRVSLVVILMMSWTGCGGSSGGGGDDSDSQADQVIKIVEQENANEFASQSILYFDALEEYFEELEAGTGGIDLTGMTVDDLVNILGQEQVDILADKLFSIYSQKIEPAAEEMNTAYNDFVLSEQEYENFLNPDAASMVQPAEFFAGAVVCAARGILLTGLGTIAYCVNEVIKEM